MLLYVYSFFRFRNFGLHSVFSSSIRKFSFPKETPLENFTCFSRLYFAESFFAHYQADDVARLFGHFVINHLLQSYQICIRNGHHSWNVVQNGDYRKLTPKQIQLLPMVTSSSRLVYFSQSPMLLNKVCLSLFQSLGGSITNGSSSLRGNVIVPYDSVLINYIFI